EALGDAAEAEGEAGGARGDAERRTAARGSEVGRGGGGAGGGGEEGRRRGEAERSGG
ncbi:EF-hand domain-containing protein, partial [Klebsiella pneumoniae]